MHCFHRVCQNLVNSLVWADIFPRKLIGTARKILTFALNWTKWFFWIEIDSWTSKFPRSHRIMKFVSKMIYLPNRSIAIETWAPWEPHRLPNKEIKHRFWTRSGIETFCAMVCNVNDAVSLLRTWFRESIKCNILMDFIALAHYRVNWEFNREFCTFIACIFANLFG